MAVRTREDAMAFVLRECREFLGATGTVLPCYSGHAAKLCEWINEALAGPPGPADPTTTEASR